MATIHEGLMSPNCLASWSSSSPRAQLNDTAIVHLYPASLAPWSSSPWLLHARVHLESTSTFHSSTPLPHGNHLGTAFPEPIRQLISGYPLRRLLLRVGDAASTNWSSQLRVPHNPSMGPSGTSVMASFLRTGNHRDPTHYVDRYTSLLRYLLDNRLFSPCGAPLDSLRVRKHGHSIVVHSPQTLPLQHNNTPLVFVDVESILAADAATFCLAGIESLLISQRTRPGGWAAAVNHGTCHSSDNWGLLDSLFASPPQTRQATSSVMALSELLLGASLDSSPWVGNTDTNRHSVWIDLQVSPECYYYSREREASCTVTVSRGVSYRIALPSPTFHRQQFASVSLQSNETQPQHTLTVTLGDLLIGRNTMERSLSTEKQGWKAWYPCPLSDSSKIFMHVPLGFQADLVAAGKSTMDGIVIDVSDSKEGYIDLAAPFAHLFQVSNEKAMENTASTSLFGISRAVQRPLGVVGGGTLLTVLRHNQGANPQSSTVRVQTLEVLPGTLMKPKMHTLRMMLYQGQGAGEEFFVPPVRFDESFCSSDDIFPGQEETAKKQCHLISRTSVSLSDLRNYSLTLHPDGTILLQRTMDLVPDSSLWMSIDYDEVYLPFQKFPADANRGMDVFPSRATFTLLSTSPSSHFSTTLYSTSLLLLPPVPDMSMPFNVISLSCTLWAFVLGSMINILVRRATESVKRDFTGKKEKTPLQKLKEKFVKAARVFKQR